MLIDHSHIFFEPVDNNEIDIIIVDWRDMVERLWGIFHWRV